MKYAKKIPPADKELRKSLLDAGWKTIKEAPNLFSALLLSIPFMFVNALICYAIIAQFDQHFAAAVRDFLSVGSWAVTIRLDHIFFIYILLIFHEAIHLVLVPNFIKSEKTLYGIKLWGGFVFTTEQLSKSRFILITIAPFVIISMILPVILGLLGLLNGFIIFLVFLNALASSVDMLNAFLITIQVPGGSIIANNGFESYYKINNYYGGRE